MVIERVSGMRYEAFIQEHIFDLLGMADSGYEHGDTEGLAVGYASGFEQAPPLDMSVPFAAGGLYSTVEDLERWSDALATAALVDPASMQRFVTPLYDTTDRWPFGYAFGVFVGEEDGHKVVAHSGGINGFTSTWPCIRTTSSPSCCSRTGRSRATSRGWPRAWPASSSTTREANPRNDRGPGRRPTAPRSTSWGS